MRCFLSSIASLAFALVMLTSCGGSAASTAPDPAPRPTSAVTVSDEVPSIQELRDTGLTEAQAECFITTIDPDGTGRVTSAELFMQAFGECA